MQDPKEIVRTGYDAVSTLYRSGEDDPACQAYQEWLDELTPLLPAGAPVLDLGCGCGLPVVQRLAAAHPVTGVDISPVQIERTRLLAPAGRFICADIATLQFADESFGAVVAFYSLIHLPLAEQRPLLQRIWRWLQAGGYLMVTVGHRAWTGREENWLGGGAPMYWSHADAADYQTWLREIGFELLWTRFIPEGDSGHTLLLARRPFQAERRAVV